MNGLTKPGTVARLRVVWLMACVLALAALAPTVSRLLVVQRAPGDGWVEVCTAQGQRWVRLDAADGAAAPDRRGAPAWMAACDLCVLCHDRPALEAPTLQPVRAVVVVNGHPARGPALVPRGRCAGVALARGPPPAMALLSTRV